MAGRMKRLTVAEARTLTRSEILARVEAEQPMWHQRIDRGRASLDDLGYRELMHVMHSAIDLGLMLAAAKDTLLGTRNTYMSEIPDIPPFVTPDVTPDGLTS
jgi:hypothetical protein